MRDIILPFLSHMAWTLTCFLLLCFVVDRQAEGGKDRAGQGWMGGMPAMPALLPLCCVLEQTDGQTGQDRTGH